MIPLFWDFTLFLVPEERDYQQNRCENLKTRILKPYSTSVGAVARRVAK
jgi:hypothetical protein